MVPHLSALEPIAERYQTDMYCMRAISCMDLTLMVWYEHLFVHLCTWNTKLQMGSVSMPGLTMQTYSFLLPPIRSLFILLEQIGESCEKQLGP